MIEDLPGRTDKAGDCGWVSGTPTLRPLRVSGLVVRKTDLVEALRVYVPGLVDLQVTEDGEHFWLLLADGQVGEQG